VTQTSHPTNSHPVWLTVTELIDVKGHIEAKGSDAGKEAHEGEGPIEV